MRREKNKYCSLRNLRNESDVEQNFIVRLLDDLEFSEDYRKSKTSIKAEKIGKGKNRRDYRPDYICFLDKAHTKPVLVIDAKSPQIDAENGVLDAQLYTSIMRRELKGAKPDQFCIGSNGLMTIIRHFDSNEDLHRVSFEEFQESNKKFHQLKKTIGRDALKLSLNRVPESEKWHPIKPEVEEIKAVFQKCHKFIWKRESLMPTKAFYEFTKLVFLKLNEDHRIHAIIDSGKEILLKDLRFYKGWIEKNDDVSPNPINSILFRRLVEQLEDLIKSKKKKSIFDSNEEIELKPSTIKGVVEMLQDYDLFGIDEDLNGRMFEVFLAAAVRGKNLGAYFTPRAIVKLMVNMADLNITKVGSKFAIDSVLDGCCGSGGFLIDAMATMLEQIKSNPLLMSDADEIREELVTKRLVGIDSNAEITRIARINMYLHGDGGSRIYQADALDKDLLIEKGELKSSQEERIELKTLLVDKGLKFDVVLTNPPFATPANSKDEHERRILAQYLGDASNRGVSCSPGKSTLKGVVKSNVLFLARYHDLLKPGGRLLIVLDNSILNSHNFEDYRDWLRRNFIIRAIIALPKYSFIQAGAGGVTSIVFLEKRKTDVQKQPPIFARNVEFTGISKSGKETMETDLPDVLEEWKVFANTGKLFLKGTKQLKPYKNDTLFLIDSNKITDRLDVAFHTPSYWQLVERIHKMGNTKTHIIKKITDFELADSVDINDAGDQTFYYMDIGTLDLERSQIRLNECEEGTLSELPARARVLLRENDVILPLSFDSLGKVAIVPKQMDGQLASTGFISIRCKKEDDAILLWGILRSEDMQKQFRHVASGYTQRGISREHFEKYILFPMPRKKKAIIKAIRGFIETAGDARKRELESYHAIDSIFSN